VLGSERPKYGILHITNNIRGDYTCRKYGYGNDFLGIFLKFKLLFSKIKLKKY